MSSVSPDFLWYSFVWKVIILPLAHSQDTSKLNIKFVLGKVECNNDK